MDVIPEYSCSFDNLLSRKLTRNAEINNDEVEGSYVTDEFCRVVVAPWLMSLQLYSEAENVADVLVVVENTYLHVNAFFLHYHSRDVAYLVDRLLSTHLHLHL